MINYLKVRNIIVSVLAGLMGVLMAIFAGRVLIQLLTVYALPSPVLRTVLNVLFWSYTFTGLVVSTIFFCIDTLYKKRATANGLFVTFFAGLINGVLVPMTPLAILIEYTKIYYKKVKDQKAQQEN